MYRTEFDYLQKTVIRINMVPSDKKFSFFYILPLTQNKYGQAGAFLIIFRDKKFQSFCNTKDLTGYKYISPEIPPICMLNLA
jgi:hypothetical protein